MNVRVVYIERFQAHSLDMKDNRSPCDMNVINHQQFSTIITTTLTAGLFANCCYNGKIYHLS